MTKGKRVLVVALITGVLVVSGVGAVAYNTDSGDLLNNLTVAHMNVDVQETGYSALTDSNGDGIKDKATDLVQGRVVTKDPKVVNNSTVEAYCFLVVQVPWKTVMTVDSAPSKVETELFSFTPDTVNWQQMSKTKVGNYYKYVFAYKNKVPVNGSTSNLFDNVAYANIVEGQISNTEVLDIPIDGYAIQAVGFNSMQEAYNSFDWNQAGM